MLSGSLEHRNPPSGSSQSFSLASLSHLSCFFVALFLFFSPSQPCHIKAEFDFNRESRPDEGRPGGEGATGS